MRKLRIDRSRKGVTQLLNALRNFAQSLGVALRIAPASFIRDYGETLAQRFR